MKYRAGGDESGFTVMGDCTEWDEDDYPDPPGAPRCAECKPGTFGDSEPCRACIPANNIFTIPAAGDMVVVSPSGSGPPLGPISFVFSHIKENLTTATNTMVQALVNNPEFRKIVLSLMVLTTTFYFIFVLTGASSPKPFDIITFLFKILLVFYLVTNYDDLKQYTQDLGEAIVIDLSSVFLEQLSALSTTNLQDAEVEMFQKMDRLLNMFLTIRFFEYILTMATTGTVGLGYVVLLIFIFIFYVSAMLRVVFYYLMAMIARYFLYVVAPIFLLGLLFNQTKAFFDNWVTQMINFILQAVLLLVYASIMHEMLFGLMGFMGSAISNDGKMCYMSWEPIWGSSYVVSLFRFRFSRDDGLTPVFELWPWSDQDFLTDLVVLMIGCFICLIMFMFLSFIMDAAANISRGQVKLTMGSVEAWFAGTTSRVAGGTASGMKAGVMGGVDATTRTGMKVVRNLFR